MRSSWRGWRELFREAGALQRMRWMATGLLILMACLYTVARSLEGGAVVWPWVRAFAEAAMVGALADWFAVTALFRHPLGLPIPHTAIVRKEKERIAVVVGSFVRRSFLMPEEVKRQWLEWRPVALVVGQFADPARARSRLRWGLERLPHFLKERDRTALAGLLSNGLQRGIGVVPVGKVVTILLRGFLKSPGRRSLIAPLLGKVGRSVAANRAWVMDEAARGVRRRRLKVVDFLSRAAAVAVSGKAVEKFAVEMEAASEDVEHPLYEKIEEALAETATELEAGAIEPWEILKGRVVNDPETLATIREVIEQALELLLESAGALQRDGTLEKWAEALATGASRLQKDRDRLERLEERAGKLAARFFERFGGKVEELISDTVTRWESEELIERIESQVGADLQFIRINGTLIGGLVGLLLHGAGLLIWG